MIKTLKTWTKSISSLVVLGASITATYFGFLIQIYGHRLVDLKTMPLNEVGDFLAGVFGPIAFGWLVIGYLMQNKELKNNNDSIRLQINELKTTTDLSNRALALQEEQWKIKKALEHNKAQPILFLNESRVTVTSKGNGHYTVTARIHNEGANVSKLAIGMYSFQERNPNNITPVLIPKILSGSSEEFVFDFESNEDPEIGLIVLNVPVSYNDENLFSQTATLKIVLSIEGFTWDVSFDFLEIDMQPA